MKVQKWRAISGGVMVPEIVAGNKKIVAGNNAGNNAGNKEVLAGNKQSPRRTGALTNEKVLAGNNAGNKDFFSSPQLIRGEKSKAQRGKGSSRVHAHERSDLFNWFWPIWPAHERKRNPDKVDESLRKASRKAGGDERFKLLCGAVLPVWIECWKRENGKYTPMPTTWINGGNWHLLPNGEIIQLNEAGTVALLPSKPILPSRAKRDDLETLLGRTK